MKPAVFGTRTSVFEKENFSRSAALPPSVECVNSRLQDWKFVTHIKIRFLSLLQEC